MLDVAISEDPGEDDRVATLGRWPDVLARPLITFAAGDRGAVFALAVLVRGEPPDDGVFDEGDKLGRTPDSDERDCMNLRNSTPFSLTSSPFPRPLDMSIVVRPTGIVLRLGGSAGTGGGASEVEYFSRSPPVLIRFTSFHHLELADASSSCSLPLAVLESGEGRLPSRGDGLFFAAGLSFVVGEYSRLASSAVSRLIGLSDVFDGVRETARDCPELEGSRVGAGLEPSYGFHSSPEDAGSSRCSRSPRLIDPATFLNEPETFLVRLREPGLGLGFAFDVIDARDSKPP